MVMVPTNYACNKTIMWTIVVQDVVISIQSWCPRAALGCYVRPAAERPNPVLNTVPVKALNTTDWFTYWNYTTGVINRHEIFKRPGRMIMSCKMKPNTDEYHYYYLVTSVVQQCIKNDSVTFFSTIVYCCLVKKVFFLSDTSHIRLLIGQWKKMLRLIGFPLVWERWFFKSLLNLKSSA